MEATRKRTANEEVIAPGFENPVKKTRYKMNGLCR